MVFDFDAYIRLLNPGENYLVVPITGGVCNITARAVKNKYSSDTRGIFPGHSSLILKHAPPFIAAVGGSAPMTQSRQTTEAMVLSLLGNGGPLEELWRESDIRVPVLLYHDTDNHVLIMSDLGQLTSLSELFGDLGGWTTLAPPPLASSNSSFVSIESITHEGKHYFASVGERVGTFFSLLHSQSTLTAVREHKGSSPSDLGDTAMQDKVIAHAIKLIESHISRFEDLLPESRSTKELCSRVEENLKRYNRPGEVSVVMGDCWPGAVLVSQPPTSSETSIGSVQYLANARPQVCVIDYEFAKLGRGPHGDIAQFLAHLECFMLVARYRKDTHRTQQLELLMSSLIGSYISARARERPDWLASKDDQVDTRPQPASLRSCMIRSAIIAMAAEIISVAFWKFWPCRNPQCPGLPIDGPATEMSIAKLAGREIELHDEERVHLCPLVQEIAKFSLWLLEHAGRDETEMCQQQNWDSLAQGYSGRSGERLQGSGMWLFDLFTTPA